MPQTKTARSDPGRFLFPRSAEDPAGGQGRELHVVENELVPVAEVDDRVLVHLRQGVGGAGLQLHPVAVGGAEIGDVIDAAGEGKDVRPSL